MSTINKALLALGSGPAVLLIVAAAALLLAGCGGGGGAEGDVQAGGCYINGQLQASADACNPHPANVTTQPVQCAGSAAGACK